MICVFPLTQSCSIKAVFMQSPALCVNMCVYAHVCNVMVSVVTHFAACGKQFTHHRAHAVQARPFALSSICSCIIDCMQLCLSLCVHVCVCFCRHR